ncbi:MAG: AAA family ATPase [Spirochaetes bacterium]|nr:AAA family ATPase [Spirochaetota bacterium]
MAGIEKFGVREASSLVGRARAEMAKRIVGKSGMVEGILLGVASGGHVLVEGVPGLAKTTAVRTFAAIADLSFKRIQFTPDLLPGDVTGTLYYDADSRTFLPRRGPVFANIVLADEINRAPAKVQSALLEAMEERQVTIGESSLALPDPFFVLATQNPIEHEGTFKLPEAQLDRFLLKVRADYPDAADEAAIAKLMLSGESVPVSAVLDAGGIAGIRAAVATVGVDDAVTEYAVRVVRATRPAEETGRSAALRELARYVEYGAGPRATVHLLRCARATAAFDGRSYVTPDDVKLSSPLVLGHRLVVSYEAEAESVSAYDVVERILELVQVP